MGLIRASGFVEGVFVVAVFSGIGCACSGGAGERPRPASGTPLRPPKSGLRKPNTCHHFHRLSLCLYCPFLVFSSRFRCLSLPVLGLVVSFATFPCASKPFSSGSGSAAGGSVCVSVHLNSLSFIALNPVMFTNMLTVCRRLCCVVGVPGP